MKKIINLFLLCFVLLTILNSVYAEELIASGQLNADFSSWGKPSLAGDWKIIKVKGKHYIELDDNFKAKKGPDVKIFLSPKTSSSITGKNATEGSVFIKLINDFKGKARIKIPADVDISKYKSLVFHCEAYSKLWGSSAL